MTMGLLISDELKGILRSRLFILTLVFLPLISLTILILNHEVWRDIQPMVIDSLLTSVIGTAVFAVYMDRDILKETTSNAYEPFSMHGVRASQLILAKVTVSWLAAGFCICLAIGISLVYGVMSDHMVYQSNLHGLIPGLIMAAVLCTTGHSAAVLSASLSKDFFSSLHVTVAMHLGLFLLWPLSLMYESSLEALFIISIVVAVSMWIIGISLINKKLSEGF